MTTPHEQALNLRKRVLLEARGLVRDLERNANLLTMESRDVREIERMVRECRRFLDPAHDPPRTHNDLMLGNVAAEPNLVLNLLPPFFRR